MERWEPFSEVRRQELLRELAITPSSLRELRASRERMSGQPFALSAWQTLIDREPSFAASTSSQIVPAIYHHARSLLVTLPALDVHQIGEVATTTISRREAAGWLAHLLLGTLPAPSAAHPSLEVALLDGAESAQHAKLRCILAYFERHGSDAPAGQLSFSRQVVPPRSPAEWAADRAPLTGLVVDVHGTMEDTADHVETDFANRFLGGGVLRRGAVQEEIRLAVAPELLVGLIVSPVMRDDEAIVMRGSERFSITRGYASSLAYDGALSDPLPDRTIVAIDAIDYGRSDRNAQFAPSAMLREVNKARAGWLRDDRNPPIVSGNWGCGVFGGDPPLKAILQWLAASTEGRALRYCAFGDARVGALQAFADRARREIKTTGALWSRVTATASAPGGAALYERLLA
jgi:poly(ADP-ribose) glycohydrolase